MYIPGIKLKRSPQEFLLTANQWQWSTIQVNYVFYSHKPFPFTFSILHALVQKDLTLTVTRPLYASWSNEKRSIHLARCAVLLGQYAHVIMPRGCNVSMLAKKVQKNDQRFLHVPANFPPIVIFFYYPWILMERLVFLHENWNFSHTSYDCYRL